MPKPFAAFDVDGTIFKSSLAEIVIDACIADGLFAARPFNKVFAYKRRWQLHNTEATYQKYLHYLVETLVTEMAGIDTKWFGKVTKAMIAQHAVRKFGFPRQLIDTVRTSHYLIAISGSPEVLVRPFLEELKLDAIYGSYYEAVDGRFTGTATPVENKAALLRRLVADKTVLREGSLAVGDTIGDAPMLAYADKAIMFNASLTLTNHGRKLKWARVNEVKDQITVLQYDHSFKHYVEQNSSTFIKSHVRR